ncbi:VPDSG-CTERM sorting domain-containing protein [Chlorobaculum sp. 24CR]
MTSASGTCVPEPSTILLLGTGLALFAGARRKIIA